MWYDCNDRGVIESDTFLGYDLDNSVTNFSVSVFDLCSMLRQKMEKQGLGRYHYQSTGLDPLSQNVGLWWNINAFVAPGSDRTEAAIKLGMKIPWWESVMDLGFKLVAFACKWHI